MLRTLFSLLSLFCLLTTAHAGDRGDVVTAVNLAGEERMLSQRIAKAYAQIGLNVMPEIAASQKTEAMTRFESNLETLKSAAAGSRTASYAHEQLVRAWAELRDAAKAPISPESALALSRQSVDVLVAADRLTQALEDDSRQVASRLVNMAGRQRMLSQRVAKAYLLRSWGVGAASVRDEMDAVSNEFSGRLSTLLALPDNTADIRRELEEIALQWEWLQTALATEGASSYRLIVAEAADSILESTDRVTRLYAQLGKR